MKNLLFMLLLVAALFVVVSVNPVQAGDKVDICHFPPGTGVGFIINVNSASVPAHVKNHDGDHLASELESHLGVCAI
jgi:hypothetical protein